ADSTDFGSDTFSLVIDASSMIGSYTERLTVPLSRLEWAADADVTGATAEDIAAAQSEVARDMGW
ncbi:hypothetical protein, partial [Streptomyces sp. NPDC054804]